MMDAIPTIIRRLETAHVVSRDCDCACPDVVPVKSKRTIAPPYENLQLNSKLQSTPLSSGFWVVFTPSGDATSDGVAVLNEIAWDALTSFGNPDRNMLALSEWKEGWGQQVVDTVVSDFVELGFLTAPSPQKAALMEHASTLSAWLHITDRCNLRCSYCYFLHQRIDMTVETGQASIDATFRSAVRHGYQRVKLKYAGGEPLLRFPVVAELQRYALTVAERAGIDLEGVVLSNGTLLTEQIVQEIQDLNLHMMISLDGLHGGHNSQRSFANGRGSSEAVKSAIELALAWGLIPDISITISARNVNDLPSLLEWVLERDLPFGLNFYRENDLSVTHEDLRLEEDCIVAGMLAAYEVIEANLPSRSLLGSLIDRANLSAPHMRTCGVGHSYLVFDHKGKVSKCQMAMHETIASHSDEDPLQSVRQDESGIINLTVNQKDGCRECEWQNWCTGGCPLATYRATGRHDVKSPFCNIYRLYFRQWFDWKASGCYSTNSNALDMPFPPPELPIRSNS